MPLHSQNVGFYLLSPIPPHPSRRNFTSSPRVSSKGFSLPLPRGFSTFKLNLKLEEHFLLRHGWRRVIFLSHSGWNAEVESTGTEFTKKRQIVEHLFLLKAKDDITNDDEKDMLDYLYTSQYQMRGIIAISLGRIMNKNADGITHAAYMRFQRKDDLAKFYDNVYLRLLKEHVMPYCHGWINLDYVSEVEDDIFLIFRKGEDFNYGVEFLLLISVSRDAVRAPIEEALASFAKLVGDFGSSIVQATQGTNFNPSEKEYTHAAVIRFSSVEDLEMFKESSEYKDVCKLIPSESKHAYHAPTSHVPI